MFKGSNVALVTPMNADGSVNEKSLFKLIDWHIEQGTSSIIAMGTTGESATLDEQEHCAVLKKVCEYANKRIPVMAGTGANSTTEAIALTQCAKEAGADACLLVTPYYNKPTQEGLYLHHKAIAEAVDIPQFLYNVPGRTACDMLPETIARLAQIDNIVGVKEATGKMDRLTHILTSVDLDFTVLSGDDATTRAFILAGGHGSISVTANIAPTLMQEMCQAALAGNKLEAAEIDRPLAALHQCLFLEANPIPVKWALYEMGLIPEGIRLPLTPLSKQYHAMLRAAMQQANAL